MPCAGAERFRGELLFFASLRIPLRFSVDTGSHLVAARLLWVHP
jgi:hypothetical protein